MTEFGKAIICIIILVGMVIGFCVAWNKINQPTFDEDDYIIKTVYVESGDTLYDYYYRYAKRGCEVTEYINAIKDLNNMRNSTIYANTSIKVYVAIGG